MFTFTTRLWLLLIVDAATRAGLTPLSKLRLHRIIFLSNCLAPLFDSVPNISHIVKYKHGPFYPGLQWEIDRLSTMGVLEIQNINYTHDEKKGWWLESEYFLSDKASGIIKHSMKMEYTIRLSEYLNNLVAGFSSIPDIKLDQLALMDENYNRPGAAEDAFIDFGYMRANYSTNLAMAFKSVLPVGLAPTRKEELFLYLRFLEQMEILEEAV